MCGGLYFAERFNPLLPLDPYVEERIHALGPRLFPYHVRRRLARCRLVDIYPCHNALLRLAGFSTAVVCRCYFSPSRNHWATPPQASPSCRWYFVHSNPRIIFPITYIDYVAGGHRDQNQPSTETRHARRQHKYILEYMAVSRTTVLPTLATEHGESSNAGLRNMLRARQNDDGAEFGGSVNSAVHTHPRNIKQVRETTKANKPQERRTIRFLLTVFCRPHQSAHCLGKVTQPAGEGSVKERQQFL